MKHKLLLFILPFVTLGINAQNVNTTTSNSPHKNVGTFVESGPHLAKRVAPLGNNNSTGISPSPIYSALNVCGLNYVSGSVMTETRSISVGENTNGTGFPAIINISGLPASCSMILQAYLYYDASYTESSVPIVTSATLTNPSGGNATYSSTVIGTGPAKCWGENGTASYRADVTAAVSGNGNYTISINGLVNPSWEVDGCTLIIVYQAGPTTGTTGTFFLFDGAQVENEYTNNYMQKGDSIFAIPVCNNTSVAQSFFLLADQTDVPTSYTDNVETANGTTLSFPNNQWNFNIIPTTLTANPSAYNVFYPYQNDAFSPPPPTFDCYNWIMLGMYYQNTGCVDCDPVITPTYTNVTCNGGNNGSITATISGGTSPFVYTWSPIGSGSTATGLTAGTYTISVEDAICNTATTTVVISQPPPLISSTSSTGVLCNGGNTGTTSATSTGGVSPFTYSWSPSGQTTSTATGLTAGTYTITMEDKTGCLETATVTVTQPIPLTTSISSNTGVTCNGGNNATVTINSIGGSSPYTYSWSPIGGTNSTATGLSAGTYTVTTTDKNGCPGTATTIVVVTQPSAITTTISSNTGLGCNGGTNGTVSLTTTGGTSPYTYSWSPSGGSNSTGTGLSAGTYTVTTTDNGGCSGTATTTVIVTQPTAVTTSLGSNTGASCNGYNNGSGTINATGGTSPYTYSWSPIGGTNSTGTGLTAGTYTVTVTDNNGCSGSSSTITVVITQPTPFGTSSISTQASCNQNNGSSTITVTGGTSPYTYSWSPTGQTNANATGLSAGTYTVTVLDANGCSTSTTAVVTQPVTVTSTITSNIGVTCYGGNNGSASLSSTGGTSPYTYTWAPTGGTNASASGLTAGNYTVTVTDATGCSSTTLVTITQPTQIVTTISSNTGVSCNGGANGTTTLSTTGGTSPYTYAWSPTGGTNSTATGLSAGTYTVTVTDKNGCSGTSSSIVIITQPSVLTSNTGSITNVSCNGGNNGSATVTTTGGTSPYTYSWSPIGGTNATGTGLTAGTYTVTITDKNGCSETSSSVIIITQPSVVTTTTSANTGVTCFGGNNGSGTITTSGGTSPYTYSWSPIGGTNATGTGLTAGTYTITVTDKNGCTTTSKTVVIITQPSVVTTTISANTGVTCFGGNNGSGTITTTGGVSPYTYTWSPIGGTNATATGLTAGTYTVTVTDKNGCTTTSKTVVIITQPFVVTSTKTSSTGVSCNGGNNGTITLTTSGGTSPYTYSWSPIGGTNTTGTGLTAGTYTVTVTDKNGCTTTSNVVVVVTQPGIVSSTKTSSTGISCNGGNNGTVTLTTTGGTSPYTYSWSPIGGTNATGTGLTAGTYTVTVKDANGCTPTTSVVIVVTQPSVVIGTITSHTNLTCNGNNNGTATVNVTGGTSPYTYLWSPIGGTNSTGTGLTVGTYTVTIKDANGCTTTSSVTVIISQPMAVTLTKITSTGVSCNGGNNGIASYTVSGGNSPYTYSWSPAGGTNGIATGLTAGTYTLTVTDKNGCIGTSTVIITQPNPIKLSVTSTAPGDSACSNSIITLNVSGANTYLWSAPIFSTSSSVNVTIPTGDSVKYYVTGFIGGCFAKDSIKIKIIQPITAKISATNTTICAGENTTITATPIGGSATYLWSNGATTSSITVTNNTTTTYSVTVSGICNNVPLTEIININPIPSMTVCCNTQLLLGEDTTLSAFGANITRYTWTPTNSVNPDTGSTVVADPTSSTTYTITGEDAEGCKVVEYITVVVEVPCITNLTIPNVFTPTFAGTLGVDNKFYIKTENLGSWSLIIFDRWGKQVYSSTNPTQYWDGTINGGPNAASGVYYYIINASCQGKSYKKDGFVQLIR